MNTFNTFPTSLFVQGSGFLICTGPKADTISSDVFPLRHPEYLNLCVWGDYTLTGQIYIIGSFQVKSNPEKKVGKALSSTWKFPVPAGHTLHAAAIRSIHLRPALQRCRLMLWLKCRLRFKDCRHKHPWHMYAATNTQNTGTASIMLKGGTDDNFTHTHNIFSLRGCFL